MNEEENLYDAVAKHRVTNLSWYSETEQFPPALPRPTERTDDLRTVHWFAVVKLPWPTRTAALMKVKGEAR